MKNNLLPTFMYGAAAGLGVLVMIHHWMSDQGVENFPWILFLLLVLLVLFVATEVLQRKNSEPSLSKPQVWDKILLFILLVVSGIGLPSMSALIDLIYIHPLGVGDYRVFALFLIGPIALIYGMIALVILIRMYAHRAGISFLVPPAANPRLYMFLLATLLGVFFSTVVYQLEQLTLLDLIYSGLIGLLVYEILFRSRQWLGLKTLMIYLVLAIPVTAWGYKFLYFLTHDLLPAILNFNDFIQQLKPIKLLLEPITFLFSAEYFPYNLYPSIEAALVTLLAYWIIQTREA